MEEREGNNKNKTTDDVARLWKTFVRPPIDSGLQRLRREGNQAFVCVPTSVRSAEKTGTVLPDERELGLGQADLVLATRSVC